MRSKRNVKLPIKFQNMMSKRKYLYAKRNKFKKNIFIKNITLFNYTDGFSLAWYYLSVQSDISLGLYEGQDNANFKYASRLKVQNF